MPHGYDFITVAEAAALADVSTGTVRRWVDDPAVKVTKYKDGSGRVWIDREEILAHTRPLPVAAGDRA